MEYRNFGPAGVKVSPIALGLGFRGQADEKEAERVIVHAIDSGINLIDCANVYGLTDDPDPGAIRPETILGRALQGRRDDVPGGRGDSRCAAQEVEGEERGVQQEVWQE